MRAYKNDGADDDDDTDGDTDNEEMKANVIIIVIIIFISYCLLLFMIIVFVINSFIRIIDGDWERGEGRRRIVAHMRNLLGWLRLGWLKHINLYYSSLSLYLHVYI